MWIHSCVQLKGGFVIIYRLPPWKPNIGFRDRKGVASRLRKGGTLVSSYTMAAHQIEFENLGRHASGVSLLKWNIEWRSHQGPWLASPAWSQLVFLAQPRNKLAAILFKIQLWTNEWCAIESKYPTLFTTFKGSFCLNSQHNLLQQNIKDRMVGHIHQIVKYFLIAGKKCHLDSDQYQL